MSIIIRLGHYQEKNSLGSEKPTIIRIIGEDPKRDGYWLSQDGQKFSEYALDEQYVFLETSISENIKKSAPLNIFDGLEEVSNIPTKEYTEQPLLIQVPSIKNIFTEQQKIEPKIPFDISIINKINIDNLNKISMNKFGIEKYRKPIIEIILPITFNYDIKKLKQTIELLELDENIILDFLVDQISIDNIKPLIKSKLKNFLLSEDEEIIEEINIQTNHEIIIHDKNEILETPFKQISLELTEQQEIINKGILEIDQYLAKNK